MKRRQLLDTATVQNKTLYYSYEEKKNATSPPFFGDVSLCTVRYLLTRIFQTCALTPGKLIEILRETKQSQFTSISSAGALKNSASRGRERNRSRNGAPTKGQSRAMVRNGFYWTAPLPHTLKKHPDGLFELVKAFPSFFRKIVAHFRSSSPSTALSCSVHFVSLISNNTEGRDRNRRKENDKEQRIKSAWLLLRYLTLVPEFVYWICHPPKRMVSYALVYECARMCV